MDGMRLLQAIGYATLFIGAAMLMMAYVMFIARTVEGILGDVLVLLPVFTMFVILFFVAMN